MLKQAFTLPQHISLKTSFNVDNYKEVVDYMKSIFQDKNIDDRLNDMVEILKSKFKFPVVLKVNEINFGISEIGTVGTFRVFDKLVKN